MQPEKDSTSLQRFTLLMVLINAFTTPLMLSAVNVALPTLADDLSMSAIQLSWVPMAYLMASAMFVLIFGRIADMFGRKRIFLFGTGFVIVSSILAACSINADMMIICRFLQGISAAMLYATQVAIVSSAYSPAKRGQVIGFVISMIYLGLTIGPLIGGYVVDAFGWRIAFLIHIPLAVIATIIGFLLIKEDWKSDDKGSIDLFGTMMYSISIMLLCVSVSSMPATYAFIILVIAILGFALFVGFENKHKHPILDVSLFFNNRILTFSCIASLIIYTATFANVVQISLYLQYLKGLSATAAGMVMLCQPLTMAIFSPLSGRLSDKFEPSQLASAGMVASGIGLLMLSQLHETSSLTYLIVALIITGFGFGLFSSPNVNAIMSSVDKQQLGRANGIVAIMRILGQMSSMMLVTLVFAMLIGSNAITPEKYVHLETAIRTIFTIAACLCVPGLYFSLARGKLREAS